MDLSSKLPSQPFSNSHQTRLNPHQTHSNLDTNFRWTTGPALSRLINSWPSTLLLRNQIYQHANIRNDQPNPNLTYHQFNTTIVPSIHQLSLLNPRNHQSSSTNLNPIRGNLHYQSTADQRASVESSANSTTSTNELPYSYLNLNPTPSARPNLPTYFHRIEPTPLIGSKDQSLIDRPTWTNLIQPSRTVNIQDYLPKRVKSNPFRINQPPTTTLTSSFIPPEDQTYRQSSPLNKNAPRYSPSEPDHHTVGSENDQNSIHSIQDHELENVNPSHKAIENRVSGSFDNQTKLTKELHKLRSGLKKSLKIDIPSENIKRENDQPQHSLRPAKFSKLEPTFPSIAPSPVLTVQSTPNPTVNSFSQYATGLFDMGDLHPPSSGPITPGVFCTSSLMSPGTPPGSPSRPSICFSLPKTPEGQSESKPVIELQSYQTIPTDRAEESHQSTDEPPDRDGDAILLERTEQPSTYEEQKDLIQSEQKEEGDRTRADLANILAPRDKHERDREERGQKAELVRKEQARIDERAQKEERARQDRITREEECARDMRRTRQEQRARDEQRARKQQRLRLEDRTRSEDSERNHEERPPTTSDRHISAGSEAERIAAQQRAAKICEDRDEQLRRRTRKRVRSESKQESQQQSTETTPQSECSTEVKPRKLEQDTSSSDRKERTIQPTTVPNSNPCKPQPRASVSKPSTSSVSRASSSSATQPERIHIDIKECKPLPNPLLFAIHTFTSDLALQGLVTTLCRIGLRLQGQKIWKPMMWQSFRKDTIEQSINVPDLLSKTWKCDENIDGLLAYAVRVYILEEREPNQYALQKDWTPLGLIYKPVIKTLRHLYNGSKKQGKYTSAFTSQTIAENISKHYRSDLLPNLLPGVTSTREFIESARNDQIVDITIKSNLKVAYVSLNHKWQRPQFDD